MSRRLRAWTVAFLPGRGVATPEAKASILRLGLNQFLREAMMRNPSKLSDEQLAELMGAMQPLVELLGGSREGHGEANRGGAPPRW